VKNIRRILVAVKDADAKTLPAVEKAVQLARAFGADLELFHGITERLSADTALFQEGGLVGAERTLRSRYRNKLEALAQRLRSTGVKVHATTEWDFPVYEAVVRQARRVKADLIVAECHAGRRLAPWLLHLTDWELLRTSPVPVLLVKNAKPYRNPVVLAAIDPGHRFAKPAKLDDAILRTAEQLTKALSGSLHVMYAYNAVPLAVGAMNGAGGAVAMEAVADLQREARQSLTRAVNGRVSRARRHLVSDVPIDAIPATAAKTDAALVVMGAISRSGLKRVLIGNTAEQVLNELTCDVLVVKPASFVTRVPRVSRGVRITANATFPGPY
jgi:universal stress protein E